MNRVLDRLYIGNAVDLDGTAPLLALGFSTVVDLRDSETNPPKGLDYWQIKNRDGDPWSATRVHETLVFIQERIRTGKVLIVCAAGMSRSASMTIGYLVRCGMSPAEAYLLVKKARPEIAPVARMLKSVLDVAVRS